MTVYLAFDPGGRQTGIVLRRGDALLGAAVPVRRDDLTVPDGQYTRLVTGNAVTLLQGAGYEIRDPSVVTVAEGVRFWPQRNRGHPCPACGGRHDPTQDQPRNMTGVLGAAVVLGAVVERWPATVVVPPGSGHGSLHDLAYPEAIRATGKGKDRNQHARSAWDASHHGETLHKQRRRGQPV